MRVSIKTSENGLILTPARYNRGDRIVGTAIIKDVTIKDNVFTGELVGEYLEAYSLEQVEIPKSIKAQMKPVSEAVKSARVVYASGTETFYLPE